MLLASRSQNFMPTLFNELMNMNNVSYSEPKMNIIETKDDYELEMSVPGLCKEDLKIFIGTDDNLIVEMTKETKNEQKDESRRYLRHEFSCERFRQEVMLPEDIRRESITAKVENGVLEIILPKVTPEEKKRLVQHIEIK
ncbi:MAG: Hsp20/alpha crystallin family protein [Candidatus Limimorpha sp.]